MNILQATNSYEAWLGRRTRLVKRDLQLKHEFMSAAAFPFLRATFYRWLQIWTEKCPEACHAPHLLAVGDLHVENFGTWRDLEGRLIWGINDFDEASHMPYTIDLVRLTTSALLATDIEHLDLRPKRIAQVIREGYSDSLSAGGRAFVLSERTGWLRKIALQNILEGPAFWEKLRSLSVVDKKVVPAEARTAIEKNMPEKGLNYGYARRGAGLGSRGHQRYVALTNWRGGMIAREAKALVPAAAVWLRSPHGTCSILYADILRRAVRVPDPHFNVEGHWIVRRLSPSCRKINLGDLPTKRNEERLLYSMGWETANVHLGSPTAIVAVKRDLGRRPARWLLDAASAMANAMRKEWKVWQKG